MSEPSLPAPPEFSEDDLAKQFIDIYVDEIRYVPARNEWWQWDGACWRPGARTWVLEKIRRVCRAYANALRDNQRSLRLARGLASNRTMIAVERIASRDLRVLWFEDNFDRAPQLVNTPSGCFDLAIDDYIPHDPSDFVTKVTGVSPAAPGTACPTWDRLLDLWMHGDSDMVGYLQRIAGYCLSGETRSRAIFILQGANTDGPGHFLEVMRAICGDYAIKLPMETFIWTPYSRHPTELAQLRGKRLVLSVEANKETRWHMSRLMEIATGGRMTARYMYGDFFEFESTAKLMFQAIHLPPIETAADDARNMFHLVPFPDADYTDRDYISALHREHAAILRWAIDGYQVYLECGLSPPPAAVAATSQYIEFSDPLTAWIAECCVKEPEIFETSDSLYRSWRKWCARSGENDPQSQRWLSLRLKERGFRHEQNRRPRGFYGLKLN